MSVTRCRCGKWTNNGILCSQCQQLNSDINEDGNLFTEEIGRLEDLEEYKDDLIFEDFEDN